ncbi:glycoside hydrolase domain-containing protein [Clostridium tarantellae]|uniref:DUF4091 domain-containing protein n=1 Tax=Clostridium tarantellae TaxID=39493 RepID=A0A6I1MJ40_9CLOT|nr:glycoside hydrolase domain-containing protein [Clostridium tarantellae]MPQ43395.1 DUF4091 domain-containing protein [Clostridium tarantellae]
MKKYTKYISRIMILFITTILFSDFSTKKVLGKSNEEQVTIINDFTTGSELNQFNFIGNWRTSTGYEQFYNGDEHWSNAKTWPSDPSSVYYTIKFQGRKIEIYGNKQPGLGIYAVSIDNGEEIEVDAYSNSNEYQQLIYESPYLEEGEHIIKVRATGKKTGIAPDMQVDFAKVYHTLIEAKDIILSSSDISIEKDSTYKIQATITPNNAFNKEIIWESLNPEIAIVDNGVITAMKEGKTQIKAIIKDTNIEAVCNVTVTKAGLALGGAIGSTDRHYMQEHYEEVKNMVTSSWYGVGWKGDILNSEIVLHTKGKDVNNVKITSTDFLSENGQIIGKDNIDITFLKEVSAHVGRGFNWGNIPGSNVPREQVPEILYTSSPINISKERVQPAWISINIPRNIKAGIYTGELKVEADELEYPIIFNYSFEVLNAIQPKATENEFHLDLWQYPYTVARYYEVEPFSQEHFEILKPQMEMYRDAGGKAITATIVEDPWNQQTYDKYSSMVKWTKKSDGSFEFNFDHFDKWVEFNLDLEINKQINCFSMVPWENRIFYYDESKGEIVEERPNPGSKRWIELWETFLVDFIKHLDEKQWFDLVYIAMDERPINTMEAVLNLLDRLPNKEGKTLKVSGAMNYNAVGSDVLDRIEDISINLGHINHNNDEVRKLSERRKSLGLNTTLYTCVGDYPSSFTRSNPSESAWTIWYAASQNVNGFLRWALDAWVEKPLESVDHWYWESGDPFYIYPGDKESKNPIPRSTPRFERLKEGIRDVEKLNLIKRETPELTEEINYLLQSLKRAYGKTNKWGAMEAGNQSNKDLIDREVARMKAGLMDISRKYIDIKHNNKPIKVEKVSNLKSTNIKANEITLTWEEPKNNEQLVSYTIFKDGVEERVVLADKTEVVIKNLNSNTLYGFKIICNYSNGEKSRPKAINVRTLK